MPRGSKRRGGGGSSRGLGGRATKESGIEKYGKDDADEFLDLDAAVDYGGAKPVDDDVPQDLFKLKTDDNDEEDEDVKKSQKKRHRRKWADEEEEEGEEEVEEKAYKGGREVEKEDLDEERERFAPMSKGWRKKEFYGGDAESGAESDENMMLEEAARLEELRAKRLKGEDDPLVALLGHLRQEKQKSGERKATAEEATAPGAGVSAQFDRLFSAEAEHGAVQRDLEKLPEEKRRGLLKSEAPELVPLLTDFRNNLQTLRRLLPLLSPNALPHMPTTLRKYMHVKGSLLLNTLANLSFYLLMRAEGGSVRSHPVVPQLVWLRELRKEMLPHDELNASTVKEFSKQWEQLQQSLDTRGADPLNHGADPLKLQSDRLVSRAAVREVLEQTAPPKRLSLREQFYHLQVAKAEEAKAREAQKGLKQKDRVHISRVSTAALLRLPGRGGEEEDAADADAPADLDEADPLLGAWRPNISVAEQLLPAQRGGKSNESKVLSADTNPEAKPWRARQRISEEVVPNGEEGAEGVQETEEEDPVKIAKAKKAARKAERLAAKQFKPEPVLEGRRATSKKILQNRGLVRARKKTAGNARVSNRMKYEKALKRRKGAVQEMRFGASDGTYEGEETGVRTHLKKSQRLG